MLLHHLQPCIRLAFMLHVSVFTVLAQDGVGCPCWGTAALLLWLHPWAGRRKALAPGNRRPCVYGRWRHDGFCLSGLLDNALCGDSRTASGSCIRDMNGATCVLRL